MTDYGHDLLFGTFVTPTAHPPQAAVDLAVTADRAGLDLVTFQDHPYQPAFLDTWTLLSWVAARTERVHVSGNVLNLPLRPPAVLARAAASLDQLSGGRFELGLGAGAFWDGVAAMGGPRLTPRQGVDALREGIEVIRALWDTDTRGGVHLRGDHHPVDGAKRGPTTAHDVAIWVGAYKPRMLELTGAYADGWLPSMGYLPRGADSLPELNARIDDAASAAGRRPTDVRRLMNFMQADFSPTSRGLLDGPPEAWVDQLTGLALDHGLSAFIIGGDDARTAERFAAEVAPAVREQVAAARA
ncbi:LLM class flavin-dependent oxidoreductase [Nocardioides sp. SYSU D00038]|uniref:LLM class flavin-dependent oxidoreductase n=1 Tax=Nocardioides sp. SYSU D00038 TaxID=2812554 RepID=UPI0019671345|nr:LLM class flavin-dependent oxidoreductase [Nocardioides sp. SYSU D00038]